MRDEEDFDERVLIAAPTGRDGAMTADLLRRAGIAATVCASVADLCQRAEREGAAVLVLAEEALDSAALARAHTMLAAQPPWSDVPVLLFTSEEGRVSAQHVVAQLGNVTMLNRPVWPFTMVSAVRAMQRARRRQYEARAEIVARARAVERRDQFLAMLGHELRNPLSAILLALETLGESPEDIGMCRAIIRRQATHLGRLVDDLLDVSRVTSGKIVLHPAPLDLRVLAQRCLEAIHAGGVRLTCKIPNTRVMVNGDALRLEQVIVNLVTNAVKYTPAGGHVEVSVEGGERALLRVADDGTGIAPEMLSTVFELFAQVAGTLDRANGGLGIGLTLVRSLVELHGGEVIAESEGLGRGSTFTVALPLAADVEDHAESPESPPEPAAIRRRVLIVEDNEDARMMLSSFLERLGHDVTQAENGMVALSRIANADVCVVDIGLPGIDGYEVARRVRAERGSSVYLIALTGYGQPEDQRRARVAGFDVHLTKPVDVRSLAELIARLDAATRAPLATSRGIYGSPRDDAE